MSFEAQLGCLPRHICFMGAVLDCRQGALAVVGSIRTEEEPAAMRSVKVPLDTTRSKSSPPLQSSSTRWMAFASSNTSMSSATWG